MATVTGRPMTIPSLSPTSVFEKVTEAPPAGATMGLPPASTSVAVIVRSVPATRLPTAEPLICTPPTEVPPVTLMEGTTA